MCLRSGGREMALVTAQPPPPAALAPRLRGLLSVSKLSLGSGTAKSQRSGRCLPEPLPQRQPALGGGKERGQGKSSQVFPFHRAHPPRKRLSGKGINGAFNVQTQPASHFPGKNQTSVEIPHTRASFLGSPENRGMFLSPRLTRLTPKTLTWPTRAVAAVMVHRGTSTCQPANTAAIGAPSGPRQVF